MRISGLFFILILSCFSCKHSVSDGQLDKGKFPLISLPFSTTCLDCCESYSDSLINFQGFQLIGQLPIESKLKVLLGTMPADNILPTIIYLDSQNNVVRHQNFMTNWCGNDFGYYGFISFQIDTNLVILEKEIQHLFKMDSLTGEIIDTIQIDTIINVYDIAPEEIKRRATTYAKTSRGDS